MNVYGLLSEECHSWEYHWMEPPEVGCDCYLIAADSRAKAVYLWSQKRGETFRDLPRHSCRRLCVVMDLPGGKPHIIDDTKLPEATYDMLWDRFAEVMPERVPPAEEAQG